MARVIDFLPELTGEEMVYVQSMLTSMDDEKARTFNASESIGPPGANV